MFFNGMIGPRNSNRKTIPKSLSHPILKAILDDDPNKLGELIANLEDVDSAFHLYNKKLPDILSNNPTMLCLCCFFSSIECFNYIRDLGGNVKEEDDFGRNCFHFATAGGSLEMMRILDQSNVDNSNDRNSSDNKSNNSDDSSSDDDAIYIGRSYFQRNFLRKAFAELEDGNIYNKRDERGLTPMHYGAMFGRLDAIRYIYTKGAYLDKIHDFQGNRPIHLACLYGHTDVVKFFVENGVKIESDKFLNKLQPIHYACIGGYIDTIEYLISLKADINLMANSKTPIFYAARYGSLGAVKLLVKHGATFKFKRRKNSPIVEAALGGHADVINYFLQNGCDPNVYTSTGETPLMAAISGNNPEVVKLLIKNGAKINFEPFNRKKSSSKKVTEEESSSEDENEPKILKRGQKARKERNERKKKMALLDKEIIDINSYNMKDTTDLLIAASRKENIEIFKLILQNIDIKKYIESDEEITNRKRKVNKEMYELLLEEKKQEEMRRKRRYRSRIGFRRALYPYDQSNSDDEDEENGSTKNEEEENEEEEKDEDKKIFRKLCKLGYYSFGNFDDANFYSDPNCGKRYQLFSNAVDFKSIELLKILIENKLIPKDTTKFYIRMANEGCADMINVMLDNDIPFNKTDYNLKNEVFNLGKIDILEKFRQKGLKLDINNDICFLSRIINTYDPELLIYVLDKIYVKDPESKPPTIKQKRKKRRSFLSEYTYDDFAHKYLDSPPLMDPVNTVLNKALQFPIGSNNSILRRNLFSSNSSLSLEKTISENEENLIKILNILLDRGFKFNPKGTMFTIPPCVSLKEINLLFTLFKEIEKREDSEQINFEKLRLSNIIHLLEEYDISEYKEFIDFLFDRNFSPKPKEGEQKSNQMKFYEEIDTNFSSALRTILIKNKYSDKISTVRRLSRYGILTDSSDDDYFYDTDYAENNNNDNDDENNGDKKDEKENEKKEDDKILQTELNLINYMLSHGTPILDRSLRLIEKIGHKTNNMELINLAFKNLILIDPNYKRERRYSMIDSDEHKTPLELACKRGYYEIVVDLISRGANINESGFKDYSSPLMFALMSKNENLIQFLRSKNAQLPINNPKCLPNMLKCRDRWMSGYRPRLFSQKGPTLYIGNRYKRKEKTKPQTAATTTPTASTVPTPQATQKPVTNNVGGFQPFFNFPFNLNNGFYKPANFNQPVQQIQQIQPVQQKQPVQINQQIQQIQPVQQKQPVQINQQIQQIQPVQPKQPIQINQQVQMNSTTQNLNVPQIGGIQTIGSRAINNNAPFFTAQMNSTQFNAPANNGGSLSNPTTSINKITSVHQFYPSINTNTTTVTPPANNTNATQKAAPTLVTNPGVNLNQPNSSASMNFNQIQTNNNTTNQIKPGNNFIPFNNAFQANPATMNTGAQSPNLMQGFPFNNFYNPALFNQFMPKAANNPQNGKK